jgi:hypothetical protein
MMDESLPPSPAAASDTSPHSDADWAHDPLAMQVLTVEHWSLLASRSMSWNESFSRAAMFLTALSSSVVALALVGQSTGYSASFIAFALILLPVVLFMGLATAARLSQVNSADLLYVQAMNRLRHAYLEIVPGVAPYISTASHDDLDSSIVPFTIDPHVNPYVQVFVTTPALVSVICSVLAGAIAGIIVSQLAAGLLAPIAAGSIVFLVCLIGLAAYRQREFRRLSGSLEVRFPRDRR